MINVYVSSGTSEVRLLYFTNGCMPANMRSEITTGYQAQKNVTNLFFLITFMLTYKNQ